MESVGLFPVLAVSAVLFATGVGGVLTRKNALIVFMSVELMLNAVNITLIAFDRFHRMGDGQLFVIFIITVAAVEAAVGLALIVLVHRQIGGIEVDKLSELKG